MSVAKEIAKQELKQQELREFRGNNYKAIFDCREPQALLAGPAGTGKEQPLSAIVWTPEGPKTMGDMKVGDVVCSPTCGSATIIAVHPQGVKDVYKVTFNTGEEVECGRDHLWTIEWIGGGKRGGKKRRVMRTTAPLHEIEKRYLIGKRKRPQFWIPNGIAQFNNQQIKIDPYVVGILIGDGSLSKGSISFTTADPFIVSEVQSLVGNQYLVKKLVNKYGYSIIANGWTYGKKLRSKGGIKHFTCGKWRVSLRLPNNKYTYGGSYTSAEDADRVISENKQICFSEEEIGRSDNRGMIGHLKECGLFGTRSENKFVPDIYKYNSESVRIAVLQGLMDTDGTVDRITGMPSFTSISKQLAEDVMWLVRSLGGACRITTKQPPNGQLAYTCWIRFNENKLLFRLPRKKELAKNRTKYPVRKFIEKIELVRQDESQCITIDSQDGLYFTDNFVVTHNSCACITKLHLVCLHAPRVRCLMARKTRHSLAEAAIVTFENTVNVGELHVDFGTIQRGHRAVYKYPNGSEIVLGGMDDPSKVMSTEYDLAYVQEATELTESDWDAISSRIRNGRLPYQQLIADCNPSYPQHWLKKRCDAGQILMLNTYHKDNPAFYERDNVGTNPDGQPYIIPGKLTRRGRDYMKRLDALTGPRRLRLRDGKWVQAEGVVYEEWLDSVNVIDRRPIPRDWTRYISIDFGFNDPMVIQWWAADNDHRLYLYREIVQTMTLVEDLSKEIIHFIRQDKVHPAKIICDHDAEGRATLEKHLGRVTTPAAKDIVGGIQSVASRIRKQEDGFPRLMVMRDSLVRRDQRMDEKGMPIGFIEEVGGYTWADRIKKEIPEEGAEHSLDAARYLIFTLDRPKAPFAFRII